MKRILTTRREFLKSTGLAAGFAAFHQLLPTAQFGWGKEKKRPPDAMKIGVMQGPTSEHTALFTVVAHRQHEFIFRVDDPDVDLTVTPVDLGHGDFIVYNLRGEGLQLGTEYELNIESEALTQRRFFKALDWTNPDGKLAVVSCTNHKRAGPQKLMCSRMNDAGADAILFLGDLVYANRGLDTVLGDAAEPKDAYTNYVKTFLEIDLYALENLIPVFSMWDDHDAGMNNADSRHPHLNQMILMFRTFFPTQQVSTAMSLGPGFSFALRIFGNQVVVLDQRTFGAGQTLLGVTQMQWAIGQMAAERGPLLLAAPQLFWKYHWWGESFEKKAAPELARLLDAILTMKRPLMFVSGDVHYSQIQEVPAERAGCATFEITSSALFSRSAETLGRRKNAGQLDYYGKPNFLLLDRFHGSDAHMAVRVTCITESERPAFTRELHVNAASA